MNKILTFQGQQPLYLGDIDFASAAVRDAFKQLLKGLTGDDSANAILQGVVGLAGSSSVTFSKGVVSIDGEILPVEVSTVSGYLSDTFYLRIKSAYSGARTFKDGESHQCWETRTVEVTRDETDYPLASFPRLRGGIGKQIWSYNQSGFEFSLIKSGMMWFVSLKRPPMTQADEHFFEIDVPGIPTRELLGFPTSEQLVPTTAYIDTGNGITSDVLSVKFNKTGNGEMHILMDLESGSAAGTAYMQVVLPVFITVV